MTQKEYTKSAVTHFTRAQTFFVLSICAVIPRIYSLFETKNNVFFDIALYLFISLYMLAFLDGLKDLTRAITKQ